VTGRSRLLSRQSRALPRAIERRTDPSPALNLTLPSSSLAIIPVLPRSIYPAWATAAFDWYLDTYGDPLVRRKGGRVRARPLSSPSTFNLSLPLFFYTTRHTPTGLSLSADTLHDLPVSLPLLQMATLPPWFKALVWSELLLQLPFFIVAVAAFAKGDARIVKPAAAYGLSVATTLVPILAELAASPAIEDETNRRTLLAFYFPYLVVPLAIGVWALRAAGSDPFVRKGGRGGTRGRGKRV